MTRMTLARQEGTGANTALNPRSGSSADEATGDWSSPIEYT